MLSSILYTRKNQSCNQMKSELQDSQKFNATFDIMKLIMAILVVAIHTEPFGFNIWLDRGLGVITRFCIPFFFTISSYFFFRKHPNPINKYDFYHYILRITVLYLVWSIIYLPYDIINNRFSGMNFIEILKLFLWSGNGHALWFLCGTIIGFIILNIFLKITSNYKLILSISILLLFCGCLKSSWNPLFTSLTHFNIPYGGGV